MEISILPGAVPLGCHIDRRAKQAVVGVQLAQPGGLAGVISRGSSAPPYSLTSAAMASQSPESTRLSHRVTSPR